MPKVAKTMRGSNVVESKAKGLKSKPQVMSKLPKAKSVGKPFMDGKVVTSGS